MHARTFKPLIICIVLVFECAKTVCYSSEHTLCCFFFRCLNRLTIVTFLSFSSVEARCGVGEQCYHTEPFNGAGAAHGGPADPGKRQ